MNRESIRESRKGAPPLSLTLLEGPRTLSEFGTTRLSMPLLNRLARRGSGQRVLVLPGFMASDRSTRFLRATLNSFGYETFPWLQGQNRGPTDAMRAGLQERIESLTGKGDEPIAIIGWSLGGIYAREMGKLFPKRVRQVITLGSPFADVARGSRAKSLYKRVHGEPAPEADESPDSVAAALREPPPQPSTAIYSKTDGIVHWRACLEPESKLTENIRVPGSHCGLGVNLLVLLLLSERLKQDEQQFRSFDSVGWRALLRAAD